MSVNKVILVGHLGKDPEVRYMQNGNAVCNFSIATTEKWTDQAGAKQERTEWHNIQIWGKRAESCGQYLAKGRQVYVEGTLRTRSYDDKNSVKRYVTEVVASDVQFLGGGNGASKGAPEVDFAPGATDGNAFPGAPGDDDLPI